LANAQTKASANASPNATTKTQTVNFSDLSPDAQALLNSLLEGK
jgi:hypothetical protein